MNRRHDIGRLLTVITLLLCCDAANAIDVYDLRVDFSNANNPNNTWRYYKGNTLLNHFTPVSNPTLALAAGNGYWGDTNSSNNSAMMLTTANGSATGFWSNSDFLIGEVLVRTTDPSTGGPMIATWTAPTAGSFTYNGFIWYADTPSGPGTSSFTLSLNNGPAMESGIVIPPNHRNNVVGTVNGATPVIVAAGDVLSLQIDNLSPTSGALTGASLTIDFTPVPEPAGLALAALAASLALGRRRRQSTRCLTQISLHRLTK